MSVKRTANPAATFGVRPESVVSEAGVGSGSEGAALGLTGRSGVEGTASAFEPGTFSGGTIGSLGIGMVMNRCGLPTVHILLRVSVKRNVTRMF